MGDQSSIEWTDATWNPSRARNRVTHKVGWICVHVSAGCENCYSEDMNAWRGNGEPFTPSGLRDVDVFLDETMLMVPLRWRTPRKVFVCSMTDLFGEWVPDDWIDRIFAVMALTCTRSSDGTGRHTFQVLTKRPQRMLDYMRAAEGRVWRAQEELAYRLDDESPPKDLPFVPDRFWRWPLEGVWLGVSVENQATADERIPLLLQTPAAVRFLSVEPLLGPMDLTPWLGGFTKFTDSDGYRYTHDHAQPIGWVIVGGESGPGARPCDLAWIRSVVAQAKAAGVPCFVKQLGARPFIASVRDEMHAHPRTFDADLVPGAGAYLRLRDRKGGDPAEWPEDLRVREFPR